MVREIEPLCKLREMKHLDLSKNPITSIDCLNEFTSLEILSLAHTKVDDFKPVFKLPMLKFLFAQNLSITDKQLKKLEKALPDSFIYL